VCVCMCARVYACMCGLKTMNSLCGLKTMPSCVYIYLHIYIYTYVHIHIHIHVYMYKFMHEWMCVHVWSEDNALCGLKMSQQNVLRRCLMTVS